MENEILLPFRESLSALEQSGNLRRLPRERSCRYDLSGNDYLGLATSGQAVAATYSGADMTSSASRLLAMRQTDAESLEAYLSGLYGKSALLFNSGYHLNSGVVSALAGCGFTVVADKLVHASVIDGMRLSGKGFVRFRHNDATHLSRILDSLAEKGERALVVTESLFSMDGDVAPLMELARMRRERRGMMLYVDEAHAFGVRGERGLGLCEELGIIADVDVIAGTFGKAAASAGAFLVAAPEIREYLVNKARSLIFSTALPPACHRHTLLMIREIVESGNIRRRHLAEISARFRAGLEAISGVGSPSVSQIVPLMIGDAAEAVRVSQKLEEQGIVAMPIRVPTVPAGTERIRFSLNASLSEKDIDIILEAIKSISI